MFYPFDKDRFHGTELEELENSFVSSKATYEVDFHLRLHFPAPCDTVPHARIGLDVFHFVIVHDAQIA